MSSFYTALGQAFRQVGNAEITELTEMVRKELMGIPPKSMEIPSKPMEIPSKTMEIPSKPTEIMAFKALPSAVLDPVVANAAIFEAMSVGPAAGPHLLPTLVGK